MCRSLSRNPRAEILVPNPNHNPIPSPLTTTPNPNLDVHSNPNPTGQYHGMSLSHKAQLANGNRVNHYKFVGGGQFRGGNQKAFFFWF